MEPNNTTLKAEVAADIARALIGDRLADKYKAVEALVEADIRADVPLLRSLLLNAIRKEFSAERESELEDPDIGDTRSWLLGALGRISAGDVESTDFVIQHIHEKAEPNRWARYWSLEGLIRGGNPRVVEVARSLAANEGDPIVSLLATAYLGGQNDAPAVGRIRSALEMNQSQWFALRAVRVVPIPSTVSLICSIVDQGQYNDQTYDAIMALGMVPPDWRQAAQAAQSLTGTIVRLRGRPWKDGIRTGAIAGLGKLKAETAAPLLIDELLDDNPAIVREAARSLEQILGIRLAVSRVVEAAAKSDVKGADAWGRALRWLNREATAEELGVLMSSGPTNQREAARLLLSELGGAVAFEKLRARTDALKQYTDVLAAAEEKIRVLFDRTIREAQTGFQLATYMDMIIFALGVILLAGSAAYALYSGGSLESWAGLGASASVGVLGVLYGTLVARPRKQIRESVDHLMGLKIMFLAYLRRLHQADQAYTRRMLDDTPMKLEEVQQFSMVVGNIMDGTIKQARERGSAASG